MIETTCHCCGKKHIVKNESVLMIRKAGGMYCSRECQHESMRIPEYYKFCTYCGKRFYSRGGKQIYCSKECVVKDRKTRTGKIVSCKFCGKEFLSIPSNADRGRNKYCSTKCRSESQKRGEFGECATCKKEIWLRPNKIKNFKAHYCSRKCKDEGQISGIIKKCAQCGKEFHVPQCWSKKRTFCSVECFHKSWKYSTTIERAVAEALDELNIIYEREWKPGNYNRIFDFQILGLVTIEVNGDHWHNLEGSAKRDKEKEDWAFQNRMIPITIWEREILDRGAMEMVIERVVPLLAGAVL